MDKRSVLRSVLQKIAVVLAFLLALFLFGLAVRPFQVAKEKRNAERAKQQAEEAWDNFMRENQPFRPKEEPR